MTAEVFPTPFTSPSPKHFPFVLASSSDTAVGISLFKFCWCRTAISKLGLAARSCTGLVPSCMFERNCFFAINIATIPTITTTAMMAMIAITAAKATLVPPPVGFDTAAMLPSLFDAAAIAVVVVVVVVVVEDECRM